MDEYCKVCNKQVKMETTEHTTDMCPDCGTESDCGNITTKPETLNLHRWTEPLIHIHKNENTESMTIGTPGKSGEIKVYFDCTKPQDAETRIREAIRLRKFANSLIEV